jgi:hypothetical protein
MYSIGKYCDDGGDERESGGKSSRMNFCDLSRRKYLLKRMWRSPEWAPSIINNTLLCLQLIFVVTTLLVTSNSITTATSPKSDQIIHWLVSAQKGVPHSRSE